MSITQQSDRYDFSANAKIVEAIRALLGGEKLFVSDIGYLAVFPVSDRKTVFFKPLNSNDIRENTGSNPFGLDELIGAPLKNGESVKIPELGDFRPRTENGGSLRVTYVVSPLLRKLVNGDEEVWKLITPPPVEQANDEIVQETADETADETATPVIADDAETEIARIAETKPASEIKEPTAETAETPSVKQTPKPQKSESASDKKKRDIVPWDEDSKKEKKSRKHVSIPWDRIFTYIIVAAALIVIVIYLFRLCSPGKKPYLIKTQRSEYIMTPLTELAETNYGNSAFWVYIYDFNRDKLSSPINVPTGTEISIPDLKEAYGVDPKDKDEIKNAVVQGNIILGILEEKK
jgi:hypothetical protein